MNAKQVVAAVLVAGSATFALTGCTTEARAERKGKEFGDQVCKVKHADNTDEAQRHLRKAQDKLNDLQRFVGRDVNQDVRDLSRNLDQLARDVSAGRDVQERDVNAISRNIQQAVSQSSGTAQAAYDGMLEAINNCD
jgi:oligoendopeptidase F